MNSRLYGAAFALITCAALVACGGGGGGGGTPPTVTVTPTVTPTITPSPPIASASYSLTGTIAQNDVYFYPTPSPLPPTSSSATVAQNVTTGSAPFPGSAPVALSDLHSVETDTAALRTTTTTEDAWIGFTTEFGATGIGVYGSFVSDGSVPNPTTVQTLYAAPQQSDLTNEVNSNWSNNPAATIVEHDADSTSAVRTIAASGTYTETQTDPLGLTLIITTNADGSGSYTGTLFTSGYSFDGLFMSAPVNGRIAVTAVVPVPPTPSPTPSPGTTPGPSVTPTPAVVTLATPPAWFGNAAPYTESDTLTTGVSYPAACAVPSSYGTSGGHIAQVIDTVDPVIGYTEHKTVDTYTSPNIGPVCVQLADVQKSYYDYLDDTSASYNSFADFAGTLLHTSTATEQLTLASGASVSSAKTMSARLTPVKPALSVSAIGVARARFDTVLAERRHQRIERFERFLRNRLAPHLSGVTR